MRLWLSLLAVTVACWLMKAGGPLVLGDRALSALARAVVALMAPVLLAGLIVVELAGPGWDGLDGEQIAGVAVAGVTWAARAPMLVAVILGALTVVGLRAF